ncbi:MAG: hypothetical protein WCO98_14745, partial [bacterium]
ILIYFFFVFLNINTVVINTLTCKNVDEKQAYYKKCNIKIFTAKELKERKSRIYKNSFVFFALLCG